MKLLQTLVSLGLMVLSHCAVVPGQVFNVTSYHEDLLQFNLTQLFTLDWHKHPHCEVFGSPGQIVNHTTPIATKSIANYSYGEEPEVVNLVSNTTIFGVFDNSNIYIQNVNLDHESFADAFVHEFGRPGQDAVCTDVALNNKLGRLYVVCMSNVTSHVSNNIYIVELDAKNGSLLNSIIVAQDDTHKVTHRTRIAIVPLYPSDPKGQIVTYVIVYDQGIGGAISTKNQWVLVLTGAGSGDLSSHGFADLSDAGLTLPAVYDFFSFRNQILVTGKNTSLLGAPIGMSLCGLSLNGAGAPAFNCSTQFVPALFNTTQGYVGIMNTGQYVEVNDIPNNTTEDHLAVCDFAGDFGTPTFVDPDYCNPFLTYAIPDNITIATVEGNTHQVVIKYVYYDSTYAGFSIHNFDMHFEYAHIDDSLAAHVVPLGKSLIRVNRTTLQIFRQVPEFYFLKVDDLTPGQNVIRVQCTDDDTPSAVANFIYVNKMANMKDNVVGNNTTIPEFSAYEGGDLMFGVDPHTAMGNDLKFTVDFDPKWANYTRAQVYDTEPINIAFRFEKGSNDFVDIMFSGQYAVAKDRRGWIIFMHCRFTGIANLLCSEHAAISTVGHEVRLHHDLNQVFNWLTCWATDLSTNSTHVYVFDGHEVFEHRVGGAADDCVMTEIGSQAYLACAFASAGRIENWEFQIGNPRDRQRIYSIHTGLSGRDFFCPVRVDFDPQDDDILEVLSVCPGQDQRILRYMYPPTIDRNGHLTLKLLSTIPINFAFQNIKYCSMGTEFVIFSQLNGRSPHLQATAIYDDLNQWTFGTTFDDLNLGDIVNFNCVARAGIFTTVTRDSNQNTNLAIYWGNNQWQANHKVYNTLRQDLNQYKFIHSYEFGKQVIHTCQYPDGTIDFYLTFAVEPFVDVQFLNGIGNAKVAMNLKFTNGGMSGRVVLTKQVDVVRPNTTVALTSLKKMNGQPTGVVELEDYVSLDGPVLDAYVTGTDQVRVSGRVKPHKVYYPAPQDQNTFNHIETYGAINVAVHIYESNSSVFTVFHGVDEFVGTYQPAHGVNAFHFAPLVNTDNNSILIAYSTAEASNNSLQFVVLNGSTRVAIGRSQDNVTMNFTKVRVVPLGTANLFYVFAKNHDDTNLYAFRVEIQQQRIVVDHMDIIDDVHDFTWASPDQSTQLYLLWVPDSDRDNIAIHTYDKFSGEYQGQARKDKLSKLVKGDSNAFVEPYNIFTIQARNHNASHFYIVLNTHSVKIYELVYNAVLLVQPMVYFYWKAPGFDGMFIDGNNRHIVQMTHSQRTEGEVRYVFWKRQIDGGSSNIYWSLHNDQYRPFTITNCQHNMSHFQLASAFPNAPLFFLVVAPLQLNFTAGADISHAKLDIVGSTFGHSVTEFSVADIINGGGDGGKALKWWPFVIVIGILVLLAVAFIVYKGMKDKDMGTDDPENYVSLKPEGGKMSQATA